MLGVVVPRPGVLRWRGRLFETGWFLRLCQWAAPLGFVAVLAGWTTTEVGRQPWTVYGLMRTAHSVSPSLTGPDVLVSLLAYMAVYLDHVPGGHRRHGPHRPAGPARRGHGRRPVEGLQPRAPDRRRAPLAGPAE